MIRIYTLYDNKIKTDITSYCNSLQISGDVQQCSRKLDVTLTYSIFDKNHSHTQISPGTLVWVLDGDEEIFSGIVFSRDLSSSEQVTFAAYDFLIYLLKSKASYNFHNITAGDIVSQVCREVNLKKGYIPKVSTPISRLFQDQSLYDILMSVYTQVSKQNGKKYIPIMRNKQLDIIEKGGIIADMSIETGKNVLSTSYSDNMDSMVTTVKIYDDKGNYIGKAENEGWTKKFGVLQDSYTKEEGKDPKGVARNMLHGVDYQISIEVLGDLKLRTGYGINIKIPYIDLLDNTIWYIESDSHSWDIGSGKYTTQLNICAQNKMDIKE
ncbi:XkdQ/YqbQ family protein [Clostridium tagluense]|uniref:XkdQ/YqbQ family protein n=1 Tax=Clostridium tagluense TaxID=360422 RepID=UPI001C6EEF55|nr:terminase [Clostridium tagluense]MBW9159342.1 terminase [Clostridium tagluense]WLC68083.1 terminase [Clostridium tagluense]